MKIGNTELKYGLMLAPMAGFTDRAMRFVCHRYGCEYSVSEMVSAKAVCFKDKKTHALACIMADEGPCAVQIFGSEPEIMAEAAEVLSAGEDGGVPPVAIDINMGCPVPKVFSNGEGSALMRDPDLIYRIVKAVSSNISIPTTVKMRAGIDKNSRNAIECALAAEEGGAALVALHGRTRVEMYSGRADMEIIKDVKSSLHIPVIANGDVTSGIDALSVLSATGADGIMVGRAAIGNPFVFSDILSALSGGVFCEPDIEEKIDTALLQLSVAISEKGESVAVREARKQIALYLRAFKGAAAIRAEINKAETYTDVEKALRSAINPV
ncbi:MAG: tRNA dihydrouridine synthase DusB [Ruminococcaceae bacterium]|nr:tRNA dihydrouridine synthase DusB [Oscillospiraceae bacterium]